LETYRCTIAGIVGMIQADSLLQNVSLLSMWMSPFFVFFYASRTPKSVDQSKMARKRSSSKALGGFEVLHYLVISYCLKYSKSS
jgi:hypothetical protein